MPSFFNEKFLPVIQKAIEEFRKQGQTEFTTIDLIREQWGHYYSDDCPASDSINANIGKFLQENSGDLRIKEIGKELPRKDDRGAHTKCSLWQIV